MSQYNGHASRAVMALLAIVVVMGVVFIGWGFKSYNTLHHRTATVCSKERAATKDGAEYRIYASDGTYVMADSLIGKTRFSTADAYAKIKPGTTYNITYKGWRIPVMSEFPNILEAQPSQTQTPQLCN